MEKRIEPLLPKGSNAGYENLYDSIDLEVWAGLREQSAVWK